MVFGIEIDDEVVKTNPSFVIVFDHIKGVDRGRGDNHDTGLFEHLPLRGGLQALAQLDAAARDGPLT